MLRLTGVALNFLAVNSGNRLVITVPAGIRIPRMTNISEVQVSEEALINLTAQEALDMVTTHLLRQGAKAISEHGKCSYRTSDGKKCAVGALIPDEMYDPAFDTNDTGVRALRLFGKPLFADELFPLLMNLQHLHDTGLLTQWPVGLRQIAAAHGLTFHGGDSE